MSITEQVYRIKKNIADAYNVARLKGAEMPSVQNSDNLAGTIDKVPANKLPQVIDKSVTEITEEDLRGATIIGYNAFYDCANLISISIPSGVSAIDGYAFRGCTSLTNVTIPEGVTSIGNYAFGKCSSLTNITIPNGVTSIGTHAFFDCDSLTSVNIPNGVTSIQTLMFAGCSALPSIVVPASVTNIYSQAFKDCTSLLQITILATTPPALSSTSAIPNATTTIYIPKGTLEAYSSATNWSTFVDRFVELEV